MFVGTCCIGFVCIFGFCLLYIWFLFAYLVFLWSCARPGVCLAGWHPETLTHAPGQRSLHIIYIIIIKTTTIIIINNNTIIAIILIGFILSFLTFFLSTSCWAPASSSTAQNSAPTKPQNMFPFQISKFYSCCRACKRRSSPLSWTKKDTSPKSRRRSRKGWFFRQRGKTAIFVLEKGWGQNTFLICGSGLKEKTRSWKLSSWRFSICH